MNLSPSTVLLIVLIAAVANVVVLLAVYIRHRAERSQRLAGVGGFMSSSYAQEGASDQPEPIPGGWLPPNEPSDGWPSSRRVWADTDAWPAAAEPEEPGFEPFAYPDPTSLEQRGASFEADAEVDGDGEFEADAEVDGDAQFEADAEVDGDTGSDGESGSIDDAGLDMDQEGRAAMEATPQMTDDSGATRTDGPPTLTAMPSGAAGARGRDGLTGMLDAAAFEEVMAHEDAREQRYGRPATVIVFELDGLAKLVDRLGTEPGDRIETALGDTIKRLARRADHVARLERGRYAVLLPETDEVAAINYVERIRRACDLWLESGAIAMRLAIGWASTTGDAGLNGAIRLATDRMRQERRRNGRGVGEVTPDLELLDAAATADGDGDGAAEAAAGL